MEDLIVVSPPKASRTKALKKIDAIVVFDRGIIPM
jgi:hypothetical protein